MWGNHVKLMTFFTYLMWKVCLTYCGYCSHICFACKAVQIMVTLNGLKILRCHCLRRQSLPKQLGNHLNCLEIFWWNSLLLKFISMVKLKCFADTDQLLPGFWWNISRAVAFGLITFLATHLLGRLLWCPGFWDVFFILLFIQHL